MPMPNSLTLPLLILEGDINPVLCNACPALRPGDLILLMGETVTDKLERRFRRRGRGCGCVSVSMLFKFEFEDEGPGEINMALDESC